MCTYLSLKPQINYSSNFSKIVVMTFTIPDVDFSGFAFSLNES